jgi:hypothetical protein
LILKFMGLVRPGFKNSDPGLITLIAKTKFYRMRVFLIYF